MTRSERLAQFAEHIAYAHFYGQCVLLMIRQDDSPYAMQCYATDAAHMAGVSLDYLAALEQAAIDAYLAEVPLPAGWTEEDYGDGFRYWQVVDGIDVPVERVLTTSRTVSIAPLPRDWPPIPLPVLIRAAVQCHRLREAGR